MDITEVTDSVYYRGILFPQGNTREIKNIKTPERMMKSHRENNRHTSLTL